MEGANSAATGSRAATGYDPNTAARPCSPANIGPAASGKSESKRLVGSAGDGSQASGSPHATPDRAAERPLTFFTKKMSAAAMSKVRRILGDRHPDDHLEPDVCPECEESTR